MKERLFIQKSKEFIQLRDFLKEQFRDANCGDIEVQHTPLVTRIVIYTTTPGLVIGGGGERIREIVEKLKVFGIDNPQIDVQKIENPDLDPHIVAKNIAVSIEKGVNYKRLGNFFVSKIMNAGAVGCEIVLAGKFSGQRARTERFSAGFLSKCGEPAQTNVIKSLSVANPKLGNTGVTVKIMLRKPRAAFRAMMEQKIPKAKTIDDESVAEEASNTEEMNEKEKIESEIMPEEINEETVIEELIDEKEVKKKHKEAKEEVKKKHEKDESQEEAKKESEDVLSISPEESKDVSIIPPEEKSGDVSSILPEKKKKKKAKAKKEEERTEEERDEEEAEQPPESGEGVDDEEIIE